jgi:hypothetical protein
MTNPQELLAQRQRDYRKAVDRHTRALEKHNAAAERVQALERELLEAEKEDRRELGEALIDGAKPPAGKAERVRAALEKTRAEMLALAYGVERAAQKLDRMPVEHKSDWLRQAQRSFEGSRNDYEKLLGQLHEARERLREEAALVGFLSGQTVAVGRSLRVRTAGVEGLVKEVQVPQVLEALHDEMMDLDIASLRAGR